MEKYFTNQALIKSTEQSNKEVNSHIMDAVNYVWPKGVRIEGEKMLELCNSTPHTLDPMTKSCLDCGATCEEIVDGIVPECYKIDPKHPHVIALRALSRTRIDLNLRLANEERCLKHYEMATVTASHNIRELKHQQEELNKAIQFLEGRID